MCITKIRSYCIAAPFLPTPKGRSCHFLVLLTDFFRYLTQQEIDRFKAESFRTWSNGERIYPQSADAILDLRAERYFGEDAPLIPDEHGDYTRPVNFRRRYCRILEAAGIEQKGLHSIRHTFAANLVNDIKQPDGTIRSLTPQQMADLLGHSTSEITEMYYVKKDRYGADRFTS